MWFHLAWLLTFLVLLQFGLVQSVSPVFGIISQPVIAWKVSFIVASYVKWLEAAGARVVPLRWGAPDCEVDFLVSRMSGLVLPGGSAGTDPTHSLGKFAYQVFHKALARRIPIWGTCQGHEQIMRFIATDAGEKNPLGHFPSHGQLLPLTFTVKAPQAFIYNFLPRDVRANLAASNLTINLHEFGIGVLTFQQSKALSSNFTLVATSKDVKGKEFVAMTQHKHHPIVTVQFHIEKNAFEFQESYDGDDNSGSAIAHGSDGVLAGQQFALWLVGEARKQPFSWRSGELENWIIWNWPLHFSGKENRTEWEQEYEFEVILKDGPCPHHKFTPLYT